MKEEYNKAYQQENWFGARENHLLDRYRAMIPDGAGVLDIGVGQGRNALPLARRGCRVTGIDTSEVAVEQVNRLAQAEDLPLEARLVGFEEFEPAEPFDAVLCFGLLQFFRGWRVVHHWEGLGSLHRHGDGPQERHGDIELVLEKP